MVIARLNDRDRGAASDSATSPNDAEAEAFSTAVLGLLPGVGRRQIFIEQLKKALTPEQAHDSDPYKPGSVDLNPALMLVNLAQFRAVNDTLGHTVGDALLRLVANRLKIIVHETDVVVHLYADEFAVIVAVPETLVELRARVNRIIDVVSRPYFVNGNLVHVGVRVGISVAPADGSEAARLLQSADFALHVAKNAGQGAYRFFKSTMETHALDRRSLENDLRKAPVLHQFELHYQPQVDFNSNEIVSFEALLRWRHPERGLVGPSHFIPVLKNIGLLVPLGDWMLREACREAKQWPASISVAVNVSTCQFEQSEEFVESVGRALANSSLPGGRLEVKMTETAPWDNVAKLKTTLRRLRDMNVRVEIDSLGKVCSSLAQLSEVPIDEINIRSREQSQSSGRGVSAQGAAVHATTAMSNNLDAPIIVKGVETERQRASVCATGYSSVQGSLISRPVTAELIGELIAKFRLYSRTATETAV